MWKILTNEGFHLFACNKKVRSENPSAGPLFYVLMEKFFHAKNQTGRNCRIYQGTQK